MLHASHPRREDPTQKFARIAVPALMLLFAAGCGPSRSSGPAAGGQAVPQRIPELFDPMHDYREMGFIAQPGPVQLLGSVRFLAGPSPDSQLIVLGLSLRSRGLTFRREADAFVAEYAVEIALRQGASLVSQVAREETIRVASFRETQRTDESVIFQQFFPAAPGAYVLGVTIRDRHGPNTNRAEFPLTVPRFAGSRVAMPIAVYQATPRTRLSETPVLVVNPRAASNFGVDSARFFVETYDLPRGSIVGLSAVDGTGRVAWTDSVRVEGDGRVWGFVVAVPPEPLAIGRHELRVSLGGNVMASTALVVRFSDLYAATNLEQIVALLRYMPEADDLRGALQSSPEERSAAWFRFWQRSDPNPSTPENERLDAYLVRVMTANERFRDEGAPGWLTERGEVFITLGEPDNVVDRLYQFQGRGRLVVWEYYEHRATLYFVDEMGLGRLRLDPRSRSEFNRILAQLRTR